MFRKPYYAPQPSILNTSEEAAAEANRLKNELERYPRGSIEEARAALNYWTHEAFSKEGADEIAEFELRYWESELEKRRKQSRP
jgi:hypothetical protein